MVTENVSAAGPTYVSGSIGADTTWNVTDSPYIITGNVTVNASVTLTIEPGVEVKFDGLYSLIVNGTMNATGTLSLPINFTSNQTSPSKGDWLGIRLLGANNTLDNCQITFGNNSLYITGSNTNNLISNCGIINNSGNGITLNNTSGNTFSRNNIINNSAVGINITGSTGNTIHHNNFNNTQNAYDSSNGSNSWDTGVEGNWWSDYAGTDGNGDGIGDTPHDIPGAGSKDYYPLVDPVNINAPIVESTDPANGAVDVTVNPLISITFSSQMNRTETENATAMSGGITPTGFAWSNGDMTMTFSPSSTLASETVYTVNVSTSAKDVSGTTMQITYSFSFTTADVNDPQITLTSPANGTTQVAVDADVVVTFNETMNTSSVTYTCTPDPGGWSVVWSNNDTVAIYSHNDFNSTTSYIFEITGGQDTAGNALVAGSVPNPWTFTTEDIVGPQITSTTPSNGSVNILITADVVVNFNEEMNTSSVTYTSTPDPGGWTVVWSNGNQTATYSHNDFASETTYSFNITGAKDLAGNDLVAGAVPNPWTFTTEDAVSPNITVTSPVNGTTGVVISTDVVVTFSEVMNTSSVTYTSTPDPGGWSVVWSGGNTTATYSHNDFNSNTSYTFEITGGKDLAENDLVAGAVPNPFTFTTEDVAGPQITSTTPANGTTNVLITTDIVVNFNEEMNTSSVNYTSSPDPGGWVVVWSNGNQTATFSHNDFASETTYTFEITGGKDMAGNDLAAGVVPNPFTFTTEDVTGPQITSTTPANGTSDVLITADVVVNFNEEMNTSSVTYTSSPDPGGWVVVWSNGNQTATFSHNDFASETTYTFEITGGKDVAGNDLAVGVVPNPWTFTTEDAVGPQITSTSPANGTTDVLITADIGVNFNEEMNTSSVTYTSTPDPGGWSVIWSNGNQTATYSHNDFTSETTYTFEITGGKDLSGNDLVAGAVPNPWTFTTEDVVGPQILTTTPANGITNVLITADIVVNFNEEMNTSSVTYTSTPDPGGWSVIWSNGNQTATFSHNDFASETTYSFNITGAKDLAGNDLVAGAVPNPFTFTTEDVVGPQITSTTPANGTTGVLINADLVVNFNEAMNTSSVTYTSTPDPGGWSVVWSNGNQTATYSHNDFSSLTSYTFEITAGKDVAGNALAAGAVPNPWTFTTEDVSGPQITTTSPANGTVDVPITADVVVNFNEEMNTSSVTYTCTPDPGGWVVVWSNGNQTATYSHSDFASETTYTFEITAGKDTVGNDLVAGAVPNPWTFTTEDVIGPQISSTTPANGTVDVPITTDVVVNFNEEMNTSSVTYSCTPDPGGWVVVWSNGNQTATFSHSDFASETTYTFEITGGQDVAGNALVAGPIPNPWSFTTEDAASPSITVTSPVNGTTDVIISADIVVTFSEEMNISSVTYTATPDPGGWSVVWSNGNKTATYSHNDFASETLYSFEITGGKDLAGNDLTVGAVPNPWTFTTEDVIGPQIGSTIPVNGTVDVLVTQNIVVNFNEEMNTSSVTYTCTPDPAGWSVVWSNGNQTVTYSHNDFVSETSYSFEITGGTDVAGNNLAAGVVPNPLTFTTEDVVGPQITTTTPANGAIDVLITADVVVTFSEEMNTSSVTYTCTPDPGGWSVVWSNGNQTATYSHNNFASETTYTFEITGGKDLGGNNLVAGPVPNPWTFTTEDLLGPQIGSTTPADGAIDVLIHADVVINFNEEMNTSTVTYTCTPDPGGWSAVWSNGNQTVTYSHTDFASETTYTFEITGGEDITGNGLVAGVAPNPWTFTTGDVIAPQITSTTPLNGTIDVIITANVVVTFSEEMNPASVTYTCSPDPGGWSAVWSNGNKTVTYSHNTFTSETTYTFEITGGVDLAGNNLAAGPVSNPWIFTTEDVVGPQIISTVPSDGAVNILVNAGIVVTFSEEMNNSTVTYTCAPDPGGWSVVWNPGNTVATYSHSNFASETLYTFEITGGQDITGNVLTAGPVPNPWTFTSEDVVAPQISFTSPANGAMDVLVNADIVVNFNEEMDTSGVTYTCSPDPGGWSVVWSNGNQTATFSHSDFASETTYTFEITAGTDSAGNNLAAGPVPNPWMFTTEDVLGPQIGSTTPANGNVGVPISADVVINFNEEMNISSITYTCTPDPGGWSVIWSNGNQTATFSHNDFASETIYTFEITGGQDPAGNALVAGVVPNPWTFTTEDSVVPTIISTTPVNGDSTVAQTANIIVTFSEAMNTSSLTYASSPNPGGWFVSWSSGDTVASFSHDPFDAFTTYLFQVTGAQDTAGNNLVGGAVPNPWSFTTIDSIFPSITMTLPIDGSIDVGPTQNVFVTFSEPMNTSSLTYSSFPDPGGWSIAWSSGDTVATFSHGAFADLTTHTFQIANAWDTAGNFLVPGAVPNPWTFTTADMTSPAIIATSPPDTSVDIPLGADIVVTFDEEMNPATVTYLSIPNPGGWSVSWSSGDTVATYSHNAFDELTTYTFRIVGGEDLSGNSLTADAVPNPWSFTTEDITVPEITVTTPSDGTQNIVLDQNVIVTFSEPMDNTTVTFTCIPDPGGWGVLWSGGNTLAAFSHSDFASDTSYAFQVTGGKDLAGNNLAAGSVPNPWSFSTLDSVPPTVTLTIPPDSTIDVGLTTDITATFSEAMDTSTVTFICSPDPGGWTLAWSAGDTVVMFSHNDFDKSTDYTFQIISGRDLAGNNLALGGIPNPWTFTTVANVPPTILSTPILSATEDVQYNHDVDAQDNDGVSLTYSLTTYPSGMTIDPVTGLITWTPTNSQVGANNVVVLVTDEDFGTDSQSFTIIVTNTNDPPAITSTTVTAATEDALYSYDVDASDIDGDAINYSLSTYPAGMTIDSASGMITWTPVNSQVGSHSVLVEVLDGNGGTDTQSFSIDVTNTNDAPTITSSAVTTGTEDNLYSYDVDATDVDSGDTLTYSLSAFPAGMTIDPNTGVISWTPVNGQVGVNSVTVDVSDGNGGSDSQPFTITVTNTNDAPTFTSTPVTDATEDTQYTYDVDALDMDGDTISYSLSTYPLGMVIDNASGLITWTPTNGQVGSNSIVVLISDGKGGSDTQSFSILVANANDAPTIISTPITTATEDGLYTFDVDATDIDSGDTLTFSLSAFPTGMTIDPATGAISWTPTNAQVGVNSVTVVVSDGNSSTDTQIFSITVVNVNDAPAFTSTPLTTAAEDAQYSYDADAADIDVGDTLSYSLSTNPTGMTIDIATGLILWTPTNNQVGPHNVVVAVSDGNATDTQSFTITVTNTNDQPTINSIPITTATDDVPYLYDVDATDVDSGDIVTYSLTAFPTGMTIDPTTGLIEWTPDDSHVGPNSVTVLVFDGNTGTDTQSFTITVADANDAPTITSTETIAVTEDSQYSYDVEALDPDMDILDFSLTTSPTGMTIDIATGMILWTPTNAQVGMNNVVVLVIDGNGGSDTQSFTITVANENDSPAIISTPILTVAEDSTYTYDVEASDIDSGDTLTYSLTTSPAGMTINPSSGLITWIPVNSQVGSNQVEVLVSDGNGGNDTQLFFITVSNTNDAPTFTSTPLTSGTEDMQYSYDVDATDIDLGDTLTYSLTTYPAAMIIDSATGVISWTPTNDDVGANAVTVLIDDGNGGTNTQSFSIMVSNTNDSPSITSTPITIATQDSLYVYDVQANDIDSGDTLTYTLTAHPDGMTINSGTGVISWSPTSTQIGDSSVTVEVFDGSGATDTQSFMVTVANVNDPPVFTTQPKTTATEEAEYFYEVEAADDDGDTLSFSLLNFPAGMVIDTEDGTINWTPTNAQVGTHSIVIKVIDGNGGDTRQSFTITVTDVNDPPEITSIPITTATEEVVYAYHVQAQDEDLTGDTLIYELAVRPQGMQINSTAGIISWTPSNGQVGDNSIIIVVSDGRGGTISQSFTLVVANANDDPAISSTPVTKAKEDEQYLYDVDASDIDFGDTLVYSLMSAPDGMAMDSTNGIITWTPLDADVGIHQIVVRVTDNESAFAIQSFAITVENENDAPTMSEMMVDPETGTNRDIYKFQLLYKDPDDDSGSAKLILDGVEYEMTEVSGDPLTGVIFSTELSLGARNHTYYFQIDDEESHVVLSDSSEIFVSAVAVSEKEEKDFLEEWLPIPLWLFILILIIIIIVISVYSSRVKKQLKRQRQFQRQAPAPVPQRIERQPQREWKPEPPEPPKEEEEDESLLELY